MTDFIDYGIERDLLNKRIWRWTERSYTPNV